MEFKKPKPKKKTAPEGKLILPLKNEKNIIGMFNGQSVVVSDLDSMNYLYEAGNFGKGTLSRGKPNFHTVSDDIPKIIFQHQFENHSKWNADTAPSKSKTQSGTSKEFGLSLESIDSLLQSSFAESSNETWKSWKEKQNRECDYPVSSNASKGPSSSVLGFKTDDDSYKDENFIELVNEIIQSRLLKQPKIADDKSDQVIVVDTCFDANNTELSPMKMNPRIESLPKLAVENLNLNLEESFFLKSELGCLNIVDLNFSEMGITELWKRFHDVNKNFTERYVTYHYYRAKGWIVKSGLKFGGDFLLYKDGPAHYHSSYLLKVMDKRKITWREFVMMNRLVETFNKDLILCNVVQTKTSDEIKSFPDAFVNNSIQEVLVKRWFPSKERVSKDKPS